MIEAALCLSMLVLGQQDAKQAEVRSSEKWTRFYADAARQYKVTRGDDEPVELTERAVFDWASINDFNGAVFAWTEKGRPVLLASIFSLPVAGSPQRLVVHEFASFAEADTVVVGPSGEKWTPKGAKLQPLADVAPPPAKPNLLRLQCRRLAKEFTANMNRRGERWDLRLLPTPLVEYQDPADDILGGGLFAFVGYSTDPEILLLLEGRKLKDGPAWCFQAVRFSDKSLYLKFKDKPIWESVRSGHGVEGGDTDDPQYRVLHSARLSSEEIESLSAP